MILTTWTDLAADGTASLGEHVRLSLRHTTAVSKTSEIGPDTCTRYDVDAVISAALADLEDHLPADVTTDSETFYLHPGEVSVDPRRRADLIDQLRDLTTRDPLRFWYIADSHRSSRPCTPLSGD